MKSRIMLAMSVLVFSFVLAGCSPEVGSDGWCQDMKAKPKGDWTTNEAADFAKHCVFK
ncbi:MAG: DUF3012 domain-containing protein [Motiliproteus sp.]|nr:DUF3012 domain-containing protein [Motiliproteus sp.]MCW9052140.1 DUF3012 domain-containing protein [Motiliproteus sp.]